jgi:FAD binding domain
MQPQPPPHVAGFLADAARELPEGVLSTDPSDLAEYGRDWTRVHTPAPCALALPRSPAEVARVVLLARRHHVPVVPSGGRTGLAGGAGGAVAASPDALEPWVTSLFERELVSDGTLAQHSARDEARRP